MGDATGEGAKRYGLEKRAFGTPRQEKAANWLPPTPLCSKLKVEQLYCSNR
jgi:hypothetical protein